MNGIIGGPPARLAAGLAALSLASLSSPAALAQPRTGPSATQAASQPAPTSSPQPKSSPPSTSPPANGPSRIDGTIAVTIHATRLKHWGVPGALAAFVPDADRSAFAERIRSASSARVLCSALSAAAGQDRSIASAPVDGDGSLDHRPGDEELMSFAVTVANARAAVPGALYVCSRPVFAMMSDGAYPREKFYQLDGEQDLWWTAQRLSLRPGESVPVHLTAEVDASRW